MAGVPGGDPGVVAETDDWVVLAKPAGWHTVAGTGSSGPSVEAWLRGPAGFAWSRDLEEGGLVHRLDFDTSGCLVVAKRAVVQDDLRAAFRSTGRVRKWYLALVSTARGVIDGQGHFELSFTSRHRGSRKITVRPTGDPRTLGRCTWTVRRRGASVDPPGDLLDIELVGPGRRHQVRGGLAFLGHPLLGDVLYGGPARPGGDAGAALHARAVEIDGTVITCPAPPWAPDR